MAILPVETYSTQQSDAKMYDLSINVYNYFHLTEEHTEDHWIYVCLNENLGFREERSGCAQRSQETRKRRRKLTNGELPE